MVIKMNRKSIVWGMVLGLAVLLVFPSASATQMPCAPSFPGHSDGSNCGLNWSKPDDANRMWQERYHSTHMFGWINYTNGHADGRFVNFALNEQTGEISNYTLKVYQRDGSVVDMHVFERITVSNFEKKEIRVMGAILMIQGSNAMIIIHDNPAGVIQHIVYNNTTSVTVNYTLGSDFYATNTYKNHTYGNLAWIMSASYNITGSIISGRNLSVEPNIVSVELYNSQSSFRMHALHRYGMPRLDENYGLGKVGADVFLTEQNGFMLDDIVPYRADIGVNVQEMAQNRIRLRISGEGEGTVFAVMLENTEMNAERLQVKFDGENAQKVSIEEIFGSSDGEPKYTVTTDDYGNNVLYVYVPHFSEHELEIFSNDSAGINLVYISIAFIVGLSVGVGLTYTLFRMRKKD